MAAASTTITVLVENTAGRRGLLAEHGLAFWIERADRRILLDTGQGMALTHNARRLGVDLAAVTDVVLSHGHYDHTGGLETILPHLAGAAVYAHLTALRDRFARDADGAVRPVGSPFGSLDRLRPQVGTLVPTRMQPVQPADGVWLTGQIPRRNSFEDAGGAFYLDEACTEPDAVVDDQALWLETSDGPVVLLGCAHAGVVNTLDYIRSLSGAGRIHAVLGGMHLLHADERRLRHTVAALRELDVRHIGLAHCTGLEAMARLYREIPGRCVHCTTGTRLEFP